MKQEFAKAEDAAKWLMNWYEENKRPAAKNESVEESTGVTDYNPKSQGGTRKELIAKYHKTKNPKDAEAARKAGATQKELQSEEVEIDEGKSSTGYELYHKDFSSAMAHAYGFAKNKYGIEVDPEEIDRKVAMGPKKPSSGKTNSYRLMGKDGKKAIQVQVANLDNKRYELNMYKEDLDEQKKDLPFEPYEPKKKSSVVPGKHGSGPSTAKHLAKMALKKQMEKKKKDVDEESLGTGWMLRADSQLKSALKKKQELVKTRLKSYGDPSAGVSHKSDNQKKDVKEDAEQVSEKVVKGKGYDNPENERKAPEGKVPMTSLMPGHSDKAARFAAVQAKGKLVKGKAQSAPQKEEFDASVLDEAFSPAMVAKLKAEYSKIDRIDPSSNSYKKLIAMLDKMDMKELESLADAGIKFVSGLAKNRISRNAMKRGEGSKGKNYLMSKNEEVEIEESDDMGPAKRGKEKPVMMRHKTSGKEISVVPSGVKEKQKLGYEIVKEGVEQIDEVKVGDTVHVGMAKKGGAGFKGTVHKIDGEKVHVKVGTTKYGDRIVTGQMKNVTKEEVEIDTSKKAEPAFKNVKKAGEDMNEDCVAEGKYQKLTPQQKFKNSTKRAGYDMDAAAKRINDLIAKHDEERKKREEKTKMNEAEGGGTEVRSLKTQAMDQKKRAQIAIRSAELKIKHERERERLKKERSALKNEMFFETMKKNTKEKIASEKDKMVGGKALSGKREPIEISPTLNTTK